MHCGLELAELIGPTCTIGPVPPEPVLGTHTFHLKIAWPDRSVLTNGKCFTTCKNSNDVSDTCRKLLYLEAYSQRGNLKFEGIPETFVMSEEDGAIQLGEVSTKNTKAVLTQFLQRVLGIEGKCLKKYITVYARSLHIVKHEC